MNGLEVFSLIKEKRAKIEELIDPTVFVLNKEVENLQKEIADLQKDCPHEYSHGECKYCGKEEKIMDIVLYKSATCPQCKVAKMKLDRKGIPYTEVYVENLDAAALEASGVRGIPTLFVDGTKIANIRDISKWIDAQEVING